MSSQKRPVEKSLDTSLVVTVVFTVSVGLAALGTGCAASGKGGGGAADPARGQKYFQVKCNSCHPSGGQGAGPALIGKPVPGPLKKSSSGGRHNVPDAEFDSLLAYLTPIMQPQAAAAVPAAPVGVPAAPAAAPAPAPAPTPEAGMKTCNCTCQCPVGTPAGQMQNCTCACACPPG